MFVAAQGSPHSRYKRAIATGNPTLATAAALELPRVLLEDALALVLLYHRAGDGRFERAALRWHARACAEIPAISLASAAAALQALATLSGDRSHGIAILAEILDALGAYPLVEVLDEHAPPGTL